MLSAIAIVPSAPVLVPELAAGAASELTVLRDAAFEAAGSLPGRWLAVGVGPVDAVVSPQQTGTFGGYGVDLAVALSPGAADGPARLPLCALITGWLRGRANPQAHAEVRVFAQDRDAEAALDRGRRLRAEIDEAAEPIGILVVADGAHTLSPAAPGGYDAESAPVQAALTEALATGDVGAMSRLPHAIVGRVAYQVLAGVAEPGPRSAKELCRGAPYGVGYFVGVWQP